MKDWEMQQLLYKWSQAMDVKAPSSNLFCSKGQSQIKRKKVCCNGIKWSEDNIQYDKFIDLPQTLCHENLLTDYALITDLLNIGKLHEIL